jgi:hypothetical protein
MPQKTQTQRGSGLNKRRIEKKMRKLMLMVAMLAVVLVAAVPALGQSQGFSESRDKSGSASPSGKVSNSGDNANLCPTAQQVAQTGQVLNEVGAVQVNSKGKPGPGGSNLTIEPSSTETCDQTLRQAAAS